MNHYLYAMLALDIARERERESEQRWLASRLPPRPHRLRRLAARLLASVSLGSASIVRRLDSCIADDLGRSLTPAE